MSVKSFLLKAGTALAPLLLMLVFGGTQPVMAAGSTVVVATTPNPTNCGKYHTAQSTDLAAVLNAAKKGKVLVCPGDYILAADVVIDGAKGLKIQQAVKGVTNQPHIVAGAAMSAGLLIQNSTSVTI